MIKCLYLIFFVLSSTFLLAEERSIPTGPLPKNVVPHSYQLSLSIFPEQERFSGVTRIQIEVKENLSVIWLHGKDLEVKKAGMELANSEKLAVKYTQVAEDGVVRIDLPQKIRPQKATLWFRYDAPFNRKLEALYRIDQGGNSYAFTQFEAISARHAFPCFDEPAFKTPFQIELTVHKSDEAITNTLPIDEKILEDGSKRIRFATTEKLPTYLLAFAVGPFDVVDAPDIAPNEFRKTPIPLRGIAVKGHGNQFGYSLKNTGALLTLLEKYYARAYPFPKLDLIAVPDFEWGAMENAGAITFRDSYLLFDEKKAPYSQKKRYANVMAHELGHQWFGNLLTMRWWDDIWLNEGLTSWIDGKTVQEWNPSFEANVSSTNNTIRVMDIDSTDSTHSVHRPVENSNDIASIADAIIFTKGAALPAMYEHYLGEITFQKVIRHYIRKHEFSAVTSADFLQSMQQVAGKNAAESLRSFLFQPGVPFVEVEKVCKDGSAQARVRQSRYLPLGAEAEQSGLWQIPLCMRIERHGSVKTKCSLFSQREATVPLDEDGCPVWIMPNADAAGYYRWSLSGKELETLREKGYRKLTVQEQLSVIDSVKSAFKSGRLSTSDTLNALAPFAKSRDSQIAMQPASMLKWMRSYLLEAAEIPAFEKYSRELYKQSYQRLGFDSKTSESDETKEFRAELIEFLAHVARDPLVRKKAAKRGEAYIGFDTDGKIHPDAVDPNVLPSALSVALQENGSRFYDALLSILKNSNDSLLRQRILVALGTSSDPAISENVRRLSLDPSLRTNEVLVPVESQFDTDENRESAWKWLQENADPVIAKLALSQAGSISTQLASKLCSEERAAEVKNVFTDRAKNLPGGPAYLKRAVDYIEICSATVKAHRASAKTFFPSR